MSRQPRQSLNRTRVIEGAIRVADAGGVEAVTMRRVAQELGIEAMSLYTTCPTKMRFSTASSMRSSSDRPARQ